MPTFPIKWHLFENVLPDWETMVECIPPSVARSQMSDCFFNHQGQAERSELQSKLPIKIGGHSQWLQGPQVDDEIDWFDITAISKVANCPEMGWYRNGSFYFTMFETLWHKLDGKQNGGF